MKRHHEFSSMIARMIRINGLKGLDRCYSVYLAVITVHNSAPKANLDQNSYVRAMLDVLNENIFVSFINEFPFTQENFTPLRLDEFKHTVFDPSKKKLHRKFPMRYNRVRILKMREMAIERDKKEREENALYMAANELSSSANTKVEKDELPKKSEKPKKENKPSNDDGVSRPLFFFYLKAA